MYPTCTARDTDALSTVTDLISARKTKQKSNTTHPRVQKQQKSCSSRLDIYIKNYEKCQTRNLAEMLTRHVPASQNHAEENKENELEKEISLARNLFGNSTKTIGDDLQSLSTDDLLSMDPQSVAGFHRNQHGFLPNHNVLSMQQPVLYSTPCKRNSGKSDLTKPSPMRFSEIATTLRSEFDDVFGTDSSTDLTESQSNIFTLNGSTYTPHKEKYKSMWTDIDETRRSAQSPETIDSDMYDGTYSTPSTTLTIDAGRTPYRSHSRSKIHTTNARERNLESSPQSTASCSHYSVPLQFEGRKEIIDFVKDCLDSDSTVAVDTVNGSGSVETLKNMLFTLQSVSLENDEAAGSSEVAENSAKDGHSSLKLAISHLSNLQHLLT